MNTDASHLGSTSNTYANEALLAFTGGVPWDKQLVAQEMRVQQAWLDVLAQTGDISQSEHMQIAEALESVQTEMRGGTFAWSMSDEDIHMNIERAVVAKVGPIGKKMHLGRSRNDLIATTLALYIADVCDDQVGKIAAMVIALVDQAEAVSDVIIPAMTHLQHGQPIALSQVLLGHAAGFARDVEQFQHVRRIALAAMPLGAAACNGTTVEADFDSIASKLGFAGPCFNSYDAVGSRDALLVLHDAIGLSAMHVGRLAQDVIFWSSTPVALARLAPDWSTGSSIMPNKRNPDVAEISRAKVARLQSAGSAAKQICSQIGSSYFSDLHELKKLTLDAIELWNETLGVFVPFIASLEFQREAADKLLDEGHILATDLANDLVAGGMSFRDAYKQVASEVAEAQANGSQIGAGSSSLTPQNSVARRNAAGGTGPVGLASQIAVLKEKVREWGQANEAPN